LSDNSDQSFAPGASRRHASRGLSRLDAVTHLEGTAVFFTVSMSRATDNPVTAGCRRPEQKSEIPGRYNDLHLDSDASAMIRATNQRALAMDGLTVITSRVDGFEGFRDAVHGSHVDVMQLQRGRFRGLLTHIGVGDFSLSVGSFSVGLRTQRTSSDPKLIVGMLLGAESRVTHWSYDMDPGDVLVIPPGVDRDGRSTAPRRMRHFGSTWPT
jgi:hypothetical protein